MGQWPHCTRPWGVAPTPRHPFPVWERCPWTCVGGQGGRVWAGRWVGRAPTNARERSRKPMVFFCWWWLLPTPSLPDAAGAGGGGEGAASGEEGAESGGDSEGVAPAPGGRRCPCGAGGGGDGAGFCEGCPVGAAMAREAREAVEAARAARASRPQPKWPASTRPAPAAAPEAAPEAAPAGPGDQWTVAKLATDQWMKHERECMRSS